MRLNNQLPSVKVNENHERRQVMWKSYYMVQANPQISSRQSISLNVPESILSCQSPRFGTQAHWWSIFGFSENILLVKLDDENMSPK